MLRPLGSTQWQRRAELDSYSLACVLCFHRLSVSALDSISLSSSAVHVCRFRLSDPAATVALAGRAVRRSVGGTSGALYALLLTSAASTLQVRLMLDLCSLYAVQCISPPGCPPVWLYQSAVMSECSGHRLTLSSCVTGNNTKADHLFSPAPGACSPICINLYCDACDHVR